MAHWTINKPQMLNHLKYPEGSMVRPATPLYPAPSVDPLAIEHAPNLENKRGNRFALASPSRGKKIMQSADSSTDSTNMLGHPQLLVDGNQNPLLKVEGNSATIWQYTLATLSSLNHTIVGQSKNRYEVTVKVDQQTYVLRLSSVGSSNNLAVFNADNSFADKEKRCRTVSSDLPKLASLDVSRHFFLKKVPSC